MEERMRPLLSNIFVGISIVAALVDMFNVGIVLTSGQSLQSEGPLFLLRILLAVLAAALSWAAPMAVSVYWQEKRRLQSVVFVMLTLLSTGVNMYSSKAYLIRTWHAIPGLSSPLTLAIHGIILYQTTDVFRDILAYYPCFILLSLVAVSLEKKKLSPAEELQKVKDDIERAKIAKIRREELAPLQAEAMKDGARGFLNKARAMAEGAGVIKEKAEVVEEETVEETEEVSAGPLYTLTDQDLKPSQVAEILSSRGKHVTERTVRNRCTYTPDQVGYIPATKMPGTNNWLIKLDDLRRLYPQEVAAYEKRKQRQAELRGRNRKHMGKPEEEVTEVG